VTSTSPRQDGAGVRYCGDLARPASRTPRLVEERSFESPASQPNIAQDGYNGRSVFASTTLFVQLGYHLRLLSRFCCGEYFRAHKIRVAGRDHKTFAIAPGKPVRDTRPSRRERIILTGGLIVPVIQHQHSCGTYWKWDKSTRRREAETFTMRIEHHDGESVVMKTG
jgi:hypothetical protein